MDVYSTVLKNNPAFKDVPITEHTWKAKQSFCEKFSQIVAENGRGALAANNSFPDYIEPYYNALIDCAVCERTLLSNAALQMTRDVTVLLGKDILPQIDRILPPLIKLCASTKAVTANKAAATINSIIESATYSARVLYHTCHTFDEKPAGPKRNACEWLDTILRSYHKSITSDKDWEMITKAIALALEDADATTRTNARVTYWTYRKLDADGAAAIMEKLNKQARTALQNDPHNPDKKSAPGTAPNPPKAKLSIAQVREEARKKQLLEQKAQEQKHKDDNETKPRTESSKPRAPIKSENGVQKMSAASNSSSASSRPQSSSGDQKSSTTSNASARPHSGVSDQKSSYSSTASSRLLSAPVRRRGINITPMTNASNAGPRAAQIVPTTSTIPFTSASPSSPTAVSVPDIKILPALSSSTNEPPISATAPATDRTHSSAMTTQGSGARPLSGSSVPGAGSNTPQTTRTHKQVSSLSKLGDKPIKQQDRDLYQADLSARTDNLELLEGQKLVEKATNTLKYNILDPLMLRRLKALQQKYAAGMFARESVFDDLCNVLLKHLNPRHITPQIESEYNQRAIMQILISLFDENPIWSQKWAVKFFDCAINLRVLYEQEDDPANMKIIYTDQLMTAIIRGTSDARNLIPTILAAVERSEQEYQETQLYNIVLYTLTLILYEIRRLRLSLSSAMVSILCDMASKCLVSPGAAGKKGIVDYVQQLYIVVDDDMTFFSHFHGEGELNLLYYYLETYRPVEAMQ